MHPSPGQWLYHQPTRVVAEVIDVTDSSVKVRPLGCASTLQWPPGLVEKECRTIARDGFRAAEYSESSRVQAWIQSPGEELLVAMLRDEQARGELGLRRRFVRAYLDAHVQGEALKEIADQLGSLLETSASFERRGEGHNLVYALSKDEVPLESSLRARIVALEIWPVVQSRNFSRDRAVHEATRILDAWSRERNLPEAAARLGRLIAGGDGIFPYALMERAKKALVPPARHGPAWGAFRAANARAQAAALASTDDRSVLAVAVWHPAVHRRARTVAIEAYLESPDDLERLARVVLPGSPHPEERLRAFDEAIACALPEFAPGLARIAFRQICRIRTGSVELPPIPAFLSLVAVSPHGVLLDWIANAIAHNARPVNAFSWAERIAEAAGLPSATLHSAIKSIAVGAFLTGNEDGFTGPYAVTYDEQPKRMEQQLDEAFRRLRDLPESNDHYDELAHAVLETLESGATTKHTAGAVDRYLELAKADRILKHIANTLRSLHNLAFRLREERDKALERASDDAHARHVLGLRQQELSQNNLEAAKAEAERQVADRLRDFTLRSAGTLAEAISAVQTIVNNLDAGDPARMHLGALERRLVALARRWRWEPIGRAWEPVVVEPELHEVTGESPGRPVVVTVGIRSTKPEGGEVILRAKVVRKEVDYE